MDRLNQINRIEVRAKLRTEEHPNHNEYLSFVFLTEFGLSHEVSASRLEKKNRKLITRTIFLLNQNNRSILENCCNKAPPLWHLWRMGDSIWSWEPVFSNVIFVFRNELNQNPLESA